MFEALLNRKTFGPPLVIAGMRDNKPRRRPDIPEGMVSTSDAARIVGATGLGTAISRIRFPRQGEILGPGGRPMYLYSREIIEAVGEVRRSQGLSIERCLWVVMDELGLEPYK